MANPVHGGVECHLGRRDQDVKHAEVLLEAVAHKDAADVDQVAQLEVGLLQGGEVVGRRRRVQVTRHLHRHFMLELACLKRSLLIHRLESGAKRGMETLPNRQYKSSHIVGDPA